MRIIALMNQKGGVGKTTTTVNLGAALAELGQKVCLIDLDPQAHLTINYGIDPAPDLTSLYNVLVEDRSFLEAVHRIDDCIALVPSSIDLAAAEIELVSVLGRELLLKKKIESAQHDFDFILLDCPPSLGLLTINALAVAHEVLIPMQPHFLAMQGVAKLLETVQLVNRRMNPRLKVSGIVLTLYDGAAKLTGEVVAELKRFIDSARGKPLPWSSAVIFQSTIRRNIKLAESPSFGQHILQYEPTSNGAADYRALAREVLAMSDSQGPTGDSQRATGESQGATGEKQGATGGSPARAVPSAAAGPSPTGAQPAPDAPRRVGTAHPNCDTPALTPPAPTPVRRVGRAPADTSAGTLTAHPNSEPSSSSTHTPAVRSASPTTPAAPPTDNNTRGKPPASPPPVSLALTRAPHPAEEPR